MVDGFFRKVIDSVTGDNEQVQEEGDYYQQARPASEDPYGDPADGNYGQFGDVRPASEDPYGDPADQENYY
ncbi:MAG TPA: hypothetical protein V6D26_17125 [Stenomitos sp.]